MSKTETNSAGENKVRFKNHYKQMKAPHVVYADFESPIKQIHGCAKKDQASKERVGNKLLEAD